MQYGKKNRAANGSMNNNTEKESNPIQMCMTEKFQVCMTKMQK